MNEEEKTLQRQNDIALENVSIFSSYEILKDGTMVFSVED